MEASVLEFALVPVSPSDVIAMAKKWFSTKVTREAKCKLLDDGESEEYSRKLTNSHWADRNETQYESSLVRSAFICFDTIYNFLAAAGSCEKAFFSVHLRISDTDGSIVATDYGHTLTMKTIDKEEEAFHKVAALIQHTSTLATIMEDKAIRCSVVVDASICGPPDSPRFPCDNKMFIQMTKVAMSALFEIALVAFDVVVVPVVPGENFNVPEGHAGLGFITADWEERPSKAVSLVRKVRAVSQDTATNFNALLLSVDKIGISMSTKNIVLLGNTGAGKSYSGNWILDAFGDVDEERFIESESGSMTSFVDSLPRGNDREWRILDTPGLNDSYGRDDKFVYDIEKSLYEAGCIHAVILCFASLERIDDAVKRSLRLYSRIMGRDLAKRLLVFVNRQPRRITSLQKKNLINEIRANCGVGPEMSQIFDMNSTLPTSDFAKKEALSLLKKYLRMDGIEVGKLSDVINGLKEVQVLKDETRRKGAERELLKLSASALKQVLKPANDEPPLKVQPSLGTSIIMTNGKVIEMKDGYERLVEYHLQMPQHIRKRFDRRLKLFGKCLSLWNADVDKVINTVKSMELVFRKLPDERSEGRRQGVRHLVYKVNLQLWGIHDALLDDAKYQVQRILGEGKHRDVTYFGGGSSRLGSVKK